MIHCLCVQFFFLLKAAFGGDTASAVKAANTAILDMADNAAKMGTPLESIQNAYQGFAKQNYTMLDNLKLGYGGTKSEMERLLSDAQKLTGVEYDMDNLGDVYAAIHAIQEDLGLTGVAADEAATTFSGSFGAMKAAAENLLANLALGQDVGPAMMQLAESATTFLRDNLLPMIGNIIQGIPAMFDGIWQTIFGYSIDGDVSSFLDGIIDVVYDTIPNFVQSGIDAVSGFASGIVESLPTVVYTTGEVLGTIGDAITENLPDMIDKGGEMLQSLLDGFLESIPQIAETAGEFINSMGEFLSENIPTIGEKGGEILQSLASSFVQNLPKIIVSLGKLALTITGYLVKLVPVIIRAGFNLISGLAKGLGGSALGLVQSAMDSIKEAMQKPIQDAKDFINEKIEWIKGLFPISIGNIFSNLKLPHISVSGGEAPFGIGGKGSLPHFSVDWYAKAMTQPYVFSQPTLFGAGEKGDEMIYGRESLMRDIREAAGGDTYVTVNVNGAENPEEWAVRFARELKLQARTA